MEYPDCTIILLTYDRYDYAHRTLTGVINHLQYSGKMHLHIADDGSPDGYVAALADWATRSERFASISSTNADRGGYGVSYNLATQAVHNRGGLVLPLEDDWELTAPLDIHSFAQALYERPDVLGCIRMGYIGYTQPLRGEFLYVAGNHYLLLDPASPERHVFAGHPRLETVDWQRKVGPWPIGYDAGSTEYIVAGRDEARTGVAWPMNKIFPWGSAFGHIGTIQARSDQREAAVS